MQALVDICSTDEERRGTNGAPAKELLQSLRSPINLITLCAMHGPLGAIANTSRKLQAAGLTVEELLAAMDELLSEVRCALLRQSVSTQWQS